MPEIYVSTDVETDGPIPGPHSMLSFGSAAYTADKQLIRTFTANLHTLPDASGHPATMAWWLSQPDAWAAVPPLARMAREDRSLLGQEAGRALRKLDPDAIDRMGLP
jgi:hypothetical protein